MVENVIEAVMAVESGTADVETIEVTDGVYFQTFFSGVTAIETRAGLVLIDTGLEPLAPALADSLREHTDAPVDTVVYTHGHVDHAFGLDAFLTDNQDPPEVIAHEAMAERFERYARTQGHNEAINARQFGGTVDMAETMYEDGAPFGTPEHPPTTTYRDALTVEVGGERFEIRHGRGETDDHSWVWCPEREVVCTGDFFIGVAPNAGNPQKVQRYPGEWVDTLQEMAALEPRHLCPGHGDPVVADPAGIEERLLTTATYLETIVDRTLAALNDGSPPHTDIVTEVDYPDADEPWLEAQYDEPEFIARSVLRRYGGWWTGRPAELKPAPREAVATEIADLAGGASELAARALELAEAGEFREASHLADTALEAAPGDPTVQDAVGDVYQARASEQTSMMARNLYRSAAAYARSGRPYR
jgi:glyoxylase-like metal-dependent hydrolase (beta-lactamase superfamily II)